MKLAKKIIKSIAYLLLGMLVTLCIYTFIMTDIMKEDYDNVFVKLTNDVKLNDIITYKGQNDEFITHRLIKKTATTLITKGDVNNAEDDPITKKDVVGVVKMIISPSFLLKLLAVAIIIFILLALLNFDKIFKKYIVKEVKDNAKKEETVPEGVFTKNDIPEEKS